MINPELQQILEKNNILYGHNEHNWNIYNQIYGGGRGIRTPERDCSL